MSLDLYVKAGENKAKDRPSQARNDLSAPRPAVRRFPPVLQFLTFQRSDVNATLRRVSAAAFEYGMSLDEIRDEIITSALELGYRAAIRMQEIQTEDLPSYPEQTIFTGLMLVDLQAILLEPEAPERA
ncbi:MAG: hypothetical protein HKN13_02120 [Rhodothermales bacterium]|nr:hypothetical protein [Rhodothermales bacterium]